MSARAFVALLSGIAATACAPEPVDLGRLQVFPWQPRVLFVGEGDLLEDAIRVDVSLTVDGDEQTFSLGDELAAADRKAAADGSLVKVELSTIGDVLPDALGRSGTVRMEPGGGDVPVSLVLAPPNKEHLLSSTLPDARRGMASCAATSGRAWAIGGLRGASLASGSFLVDPASRVVTEGPGLAQARAFAACVADESGGVFLVGGCDAAGSPVGGVAHSASGDLGSPFVQRSAGAGAGCHTRAARLDDGRLVAQRGARLDVYSPETGTEVTLTVEARIAPVLAAFPGDEARVLVSGGFSDEGLTQPVPGGRIYTIGEAAVEEDLPLLAAFSAATVADGGVIVIHERDLSRLATNGTLELVHEAALPQAFAAAAMVPLHDGRFAILSRAGSEIAVVGAEEPRVLPLSPPRPNATLLSDAGGALLVVGGDVGGVSVLVVD